MSRANLSIYLLVFALAAVLGGCGHSHDHPPHDHAPADAKDEIEPVSITCFTDKSELFMEYPPLVVGQSAKFLAHFTILANGTPLTQGPITLEISGPSDTAKQIVIASPKRDGLFVPELVFNKAGIHKARVIIKSPLLDDTIDVPDLVVHADAASERAASVAATAAPEPSDAVPFLMEQQWQLGMLLAKAEPQSLSVRLPVSGVIVPAPNTVALAAAPINGRLVGQEGGSLPVIGDKVKAGQVLAHIALSTRELVEDRAGRATAESLQIEVALRRLDIGAKSIEFERAIAEARVRFKSAENVATRVTALKSQGLATQDQVELAKTELESSRAALETASTLLKAHDEMKKRYSEVEALMSRGKIAAEAHSGLIPVVAPISGTVVAAFHSAGEQLDSNAPIWRIVDHSKVQLEARVSEFDVARLPSAPGAKLKMPSGPTIDVGASGGKLIHVGSEVDQSSRTVPIRYELPNVEGVLRLGMVVEVQLEVNRISDALTIPESAVVMDQGRPVVYAVLGGESFQRREVVLGVRSDGLVQVLKGIAHGERVARTSAYSIRLASLSPATFGHGHSH